ncbi:amino acid ABC transporter permease [Planktotalea sp.]|uniref:amino acid ABC transporter permease n=1 Tax=Planktotalea sp. TaxID=2029877 RepID=UPI0032992DB1
MTDTNTTPVAFVRDAMLAEKSPPVTSSGPIGWLRSNLFPNAFSSILTIVALYFIYKIVSGAFPWFANGVWDTPSLAACREVLQGTVGGCFSVLTERWNQLLFGFTYPEEHYWRPALAFVLLSVAVVPLMFMNHMEKATKGLAIALAVLGVLVLIIGSAAQGIVVVLIAGAVFAASIMAKSDAKKVRGWMLMTTAIYPFLAFWLIWGGTILTPVFAALGFVGGYIAFTKLEKQSFAMGLIGGVIAAFVVWWVSGFISGALPGFLALEAIPSRDMGGFMLNFILGVVCVSLSIPLGIVLALGRQSDMPIIKGICVVFIEFIRGVPLITLLFVANVVLAYFLPPGTTFDLILRVIIMITMFSAAYIAEVIRGGLAALPKGQYEAGDSLGLDYAQNMRLIILPQALKISIPGIVNVAVGLFKDTALVSVISMFDLVGMIRGPILASAEWNGVYWELFGFAALLFFVVCYGISQYSQWLERQLATGHR